MFSLDSKTLSLNNKVCKGKPNIKLTVGFIDEDGVKTIKVFNEAGEIENSNYVYEIGSITKTFTTSLLAMYIQQQKMSLDDSILKYVNGLDSGKYYPTLKRLCTHTAGYAQSLPFNGWVEFYRKTLNTRATGAFPFQLDIEKMKTFLQKNELQDKDYKWSYSNFGIALVGYAIGKVSGNGYHETMDAFLLNELGLKYTYTGTRPNENLHGFNRKNKDIGNWKWGNDLTAPAGDISTLVG